MNVLLPLLIVAIDPAAPIEVRYPEGTEIFRCTFDESWDANFDGWPDGWTRRRGPGFPPYLSVRISEKRSSPGDRCLQIDLDGAAAVAQSPLIPARHLYSYVLEGLLNTEGLQHDWAYLSLAFLDEKRQRLETSHSEKVRRTQGWQKTRVGPVVPRDPQTRFAVIGLHLEPGAQADLTGAARFDDIRLGRLPRISLSANSVDHVYSDPEQVRIICEASGFTDEAASVIFSLSDPWGGPLVECERRLKTGMVPTGSELPSNETADEPPILVGSVDWSPPLPGPGFYRVRAVMKERESAGLPCALRLAVIQPERAPEESEFGWSLPRGDRPLPVAELSKLLGQAGIRWVKYPLWFDDRDGGGRMQKAIRLGEQCAMRGIEVVGLLSDPPGELRARFDDSQSLCAAEVFNGGPEDWYPSLETVMTRLATQVRWWQLGRDTDTSFVGYPHLCEKITQVKTELDRIGHDVNLGFGWSWMQELPEAPEEKAPWRFLALSAEPSLTHKELSDYLPATARPGLRRWVVVEPLSRHRYALDVRITDLVQRMMSAKIHGADGVFVPDPFGDAHGLMGDDGTAGELFLPWRTTALMLGGAGHLGNIQLPDGSKNRVFARDGEAMMVVWNPSPTKEVIYLGRDVRQVDLWGRSTVPTKEGHRQVIDVGPLPQFVTGIDEAIIRWRQNLVLASDRIPSIFGRPHQNSLHLRNCFGRGIAGSLRLSTPRRWEVRPRQAGFQLEGGQSLERAFEITLPYNATSGRHKVRFDFEIEADETIRFSVYRHVDVGLGDVYIDVASGLNDQGELEVQQRLVNESERPVSFRCQLFVPNRRRLKTDVVGLGRGSDVKTYRLPDGSELVGKPLWLRAEEMDGPRILSYRFVAAP